MDTENIVGQSAVETLSRENRFLEKIGSGVVGEIQITEHRIHGKEHGLSQQNSLIIISSVPARRSESRGIAAYLRVFRHVYATKRRYDAQARRRDHL